jgi:hypothetical protein
LTTPKITLHRRGAAQEGGVDQPSGHTLQYLVRPKKKKKKNSARALDARAELRRSVGPPGECRLRDGAKSRAAHERAGPDDDALAV